MAKLTRVQRAQAALDAAWASGRDGAPFGPRGGRKVWRSINKDHERLWNGLLRVAKRYGVRVYLMSAADRNRERTYRDGSGTYLAAGTFQAPAKIQLAYRSTRTLAHELAHALDYQLGDGYRGSEVIATAVETLVCGTASRSYHTNVSYAKTAYGTRLEYEAQQERIAVIYETIMEGLSN